MSDPTGHEGERGVSPVARIKKPLMSRRTAGFVVIGLASVVAGYTLWRNSNPSEAPIKQRLPERLGVQVAYSAPPLVLPPAKEPPALAPAAIPQPLRYNPPPPPSDGLPLPKRDPVTQVIPNAAIVTPPTPPRPHMLSFAEPPARTKAGAQASDGSVSATTGPPSSTVSYSASHAAGVDAGLLGDQTFLLMPGLLPCTLTTAINSTFPGPVECAVPFDIKRNGVVLIDRGSVIHGMYQNNIQRGQARIFVQADWMHDPVSGCYMSFENAPMADSIGQAGLPGNVDNHYLERFGAAMLLTLGQMGESLAQASLSKGGNTYLNFNSGGGVESIASAILQSQINIPPTITMHQGDSVAVFTTKILNFGPCYSLEIRRGH